MLYVVICRSHHEINKDPRVKYYSSEESFKQALLDGEFGESPNFRNLCDLPILITDWKPEDVVVIRGDELVFEKQFILKENPPTFRMDEGTHFTEYARSL